AVAAEQRLHTIGLSQPSTVIGRHCGRIAEGLIVSSSEHGYHTHDIIEGHVVLVMVGREVTCRDAGVFHLVITFCGEADGIGCRRAARYRSENTRNGGTVGSPAQKRTASL